MEKHTIARIRSSKILYILYSFWIFILIIVVRLFYLQIDQQGVFLSLGEKNFIRTEIISPLRGDVFDCQEVLLAANRPVFDLYWQGKGDTKWLQESPVVATVFSVLGIEDVAEYQTLLAYAERYSRRVLIKQDVSFGAVCQLNEQCVANGDRLVIANRFERFYPHRTLASHVLGYLSRSDQKGCSGVEQCFEPSLQGTAGYNRSVINATGKVLQQTVGREAQAGADLTLTLDSELQRLAESLFPQDSAGSFILMDPATGALRVLSSVPSYDPNLFLRPITTDDWGRLMVNNPLMNRATCATYPPASIFKLVTFTAGLEDGLITTETEMPCSGSTKFAGRPYHCKNRKGHGVLSPKQALACSCNIPCYNIGKKIHVDRLAHYAQKFGLGQKTNFVLPEKRGLVPSSGWKKRTLGEQWWRGETLSISIGQGYLLSTPMQIVRMLGAVSTGYLVKPRLLEHEPQERTKLDVLPSTLNFLRGALREAVASGTSKRIAWLKDFEVSAKTGTAQTCSLSIEQKYKHLLEHAWFAGYFSYKGSSPLVMVLFVENVGTSNVAVQMAATFLKAYKKLYEQKQSSVF